jgi:phosphoribosylamine--glycine ligase
LPNNKPGQEAWRLESLEASKQIGFQDFGLPSLLAWFATFVVNNFNKDSLNGDYSKGGTLSAAEKKPHRSGAPAVVGIVMGSDSDLGVMENAAKVLKDFGVAFEITVASAHRSPRRAAQWASSARQRGIKVIIAGAGHAAHLAGAMAAHSSLPIIGVPIDSSCLQGMDALLATVQMPPGIPVATMAIGKSGAKNAGILAVQILALADDRLAAKLEKYKQTMADEVEQKAKKLTRAHSS